MEIRASLPRLLRGGRIGFVLASVVVGSGVRGLRGGFGPRDLGCYGGGMGRDRWWVVWRLAEGVCLRVVRLAAEVGCFEFGIELPEAGPIAGCEGVQVGVAGDEATEERPIFRGGGQCGPDGIHEHVTAGLGEGIALSLFVFEDVIVRLVLKAGVAERGFQVTAEEGEAVFLVGVVAKSHPDEMNVIGHEDVSRAKQSFSGAGVEH